ncbi:MAG: twin-arginine translocation signal domain-containing protein [Adlercreutzia equolifaciens]
MEGTNVSRRDFLRGAGAVARRQEPSSLAEARRRPQL